MRDLIRWAAGAGLCGALIGVVYVARVLWGGCPCCDTEDAA